MPDMDLSDIPLLEPRGLAVGAASLDAVMAPVLTLLAQARGLTIILNDPQRATASSATLEILHDRLAGLPVRALIATGSHSYTESQRQAFEHKLRQSLPFRAVAWHDCRSNDCIGIGAGTSAWLGHPWLMDESYELLAIGSCEPHYFAGITGAHKTMTIGVAAFDSIQANHAHALSAAARPFALEGNPVYEGVAAMVGQVIAQREVHAVNLLQVGDRVISASAGGPLEALAAMSPAVRATYRCSIPAPADALLLEADGVLGRSFYQADKAIKNNEWAVRDGGRLILAAPCPDGLGQADFAELLRQCPDYASCRRWLDTHSYRLGDHKALKLRYLTDQRKVLVIVVSPGLSDQEARLLGFAKAPTLADALAMAEIDPARQSVYRVRNAANACALVDAEL